MKIGNIVIKRSGDEITTELLLLSILLFSMTIIFPEIMYLLGLSSYFLFIASFLTRKWSLPFKNSVDLIYLLFCITILFVLLRPIIYLDLSGYEKEFFYTYGIPGHILPLFLLLSMHEAPLYIVKKYIYIYGVIGVCVFGVNFNSIFVDNIDLNFREYQEYLMLIGKPISFLTASIVILLIPQFFSKKMRVLAVVSFLIILFIQAFAARRGGLALLLLFLCFAIYLILDKKYNTKLKYFLFASILLSLGFLIYSVADNFILLLERLDVDSRSGVEEYFYRSMNNNYLDWIFGKGLGGTYYFPIGDPDYFRINRGIIETGYLFYILKGGIIYLFGYVLILSIAVIKGFFFSKNRFCKGLSLYILYNLIGLYPLGLPSFSLETFVLWLSVVWCIRNSCLIRSDDEIYSLFKMRKYE